MKTYQEQLDDATVEYPMMPNMTIYHSDVLKLDNGFLRPLRHSDGYSMLGGGGTKALLTSDFGKGPDKFKYSLEYKVSTDKPATIKVLDDPYITFNIGISPKDAGDNVLIMGKIEEPSAEPVEVLFTKRDDDETR